MERLASWVGPRGWRQTVLPLLLLLLLLGSVVYGLAAAVRGIEPGFLWPLVGLGFLWGWALGRSRWPGWLRAALSLVVGTALLVVHVGELGGPLLDLFEGLAGALWQLAQGQMPPSLAPLQVAWGDLVGGLQALGLRLYTWLQGLAGGQALFDPVPIAFLWGLAAWGAVVWAGWAFRRRAPTLQTVAPAAVLLAVALAYVGGPALYLLPLLGSTLVLKAWLGHERRRQAWEQGGIDYAARVRANTIWLAAGLALALMVAAAITPSISVYRIAEFVGSLGEDRSGQEEMARSLGLEPQSEAGPTSLSILAARRSPGLPTRHLIGSGPELSERVVMLVGLEALDSGEAQDASARTATRYRWRGLTYDAYSERGWSANYSAKISYEAGEAALSDARPARQLLRHQVRLVGEQRELLFVAGFLVTADRDFQIAWRAQPDEDHPGDAFGAMVEAPRYRADALLPVVGQANLRAAGQDYPDWVAERYLALPQSVPDRVLALARDLTAAEATPYDRALAIERYLRRFPYTLDLPSPPTDQDVVDYFLFDLQRGYCDYYASAMVILARAAGLPARLVTGYASGTYDEAEGHYVVTEAEAHAWPEIYFPGYGWIEFEPTAGRPKLERPAAVDVPDVPESDAPPEPITAHRLRVRWAWWLGVGGGLLLLGLGGVVVWLLVDAWRMRRLPPQQAIVDVYQRLHRYGRWLGVLSRPGDTPHEFAEALELRVADLAASRRWGAPLHAAPGEIDWLAELCTRAQYSRHKPKAAEKSRAIQAWGRLRRRMWWARVLTWGS